MALSDLQIKTAYQCGDIFIFPYNQKQITSCAYDVRLGHYVIRSKCAPTFLGQNTPPINPWHPNYDYWAEPELALIVKDEADSQRIGLPPGAQYHLIHPGELILGHTMEFIGGIKSITTKMQARSSIARIGITICACAGLGDVGFTNRWCMEIRNSSTVTLVLPVGQRIGQIVFIPVGEVGQNYADTGHYQSNRDPVETVKMWSPQQLYPRLWLSFESEYTTILQ